MNCGMPIKKFYAGWSRKLPCVKCDRLSQGSGRAVAEDAVVSYGV